MELKIKFYFRELLTAYKTPADETNIPMKNYTTNNCG